MKTERNVLGLSGGRDSAALAVYMKTNYPDLKMDYFFTDTGNELPEVYKFLYKLEGFLGCEIARLNTQKSFEYYLEQFNYFLPSPNSRWCTRVLKIEPFKKWVKPDIEKGVTINNFVAIRSDEAHRGAITNEHGMKTILPFVEDDIDKADVKELLASSGLGEPEYYKWRTRSGCTFCFYQRKVEWLGLLERYPDAFARAKELEELSCQNGKFTWMPKEKLEDLECPKRQASIWSEHKIRLKSAAKKLKQNPLRPNSKKVDMDEIYLNDKICITCHK